MTLETITLDEIVKLFKKKLGLKLCRTSVYYYISHKNFPQSLKLGRPRIWKKKAVLAWFKKQNLG